MYRDDADYQLVELRWYDTRFFPRGPAKESSLNNDYNNPCEGLKSIKSPLVALPWRYQRVSSFMQTRLSCFDDTHGKRNTQNVILINFAY